MQTNNILILALKEFLVLKDNKLNKINFFYKVKGGPSTRNSINL